MHNIAGFLGGRKEEMPLLSYLLEDFFKPIFVCIAGKERQGWERVDRSGNSGSQKEWEKSGEERKRMDRSGKNGKE
jgi:hypothetical protein